MFNMQMDKSNKFFVQCILNGTWHIYKIHTLLKYLSHFIYTSDIQDLKLQVTSNRNLQNMDSLYFILSARLINFPEWNNFDTNFVDNRKRLKRYDLISTNGRELNIHMRIVNWRQTITRSSVDRLRSTTCSDMTVNPIISSGWVFVDSSSATVKLGV